MSDWMDAEAHAERALEMFERGRWTEAEAELRKALSLNPDQAEWHFNLGLTLEQAGRDADALGCYERAVELMGDEAEPLLAAGVVANRLGHFDRAIKHFEQAIRLEPEFEEAYAHKIESHLRSGNHDEAETTFYLAQHALPEPSAQCLAVMAESLMQRGLHERAEWCLREAMRLEPNMPRVRARLASVFAATGKPQRALQLYLRELRDDPGNIPTLLDFGVLLLDIGRYPEAAEKFRRVLELEPANIDAHFRLGQIALASHRYEQASIEFELVLKLDPQFPGIRIALGEAMLRRERLADAKRYLLEEHEMLRASVAALGPAVSRHVSEGEEMDAATSAALDQWPPTDLTRLAHLLLEVDEPARAAGLLEAIVQVEPTADMLRSLALAKFLAGDLEGGALVSRRALRRDPQCIRSIHNLALAALRQNRLAIAWGWVQRGMRINRHDDDLRRLRVRVLMAMAAQWWRVLSRRTAHRLAARLRRIVVQLSAKL